MEDKEGDIIRDVAWRRTTYNHSRNISNMESYWNPAPFMSQDLLFYE